MTSQIDDLIRMRDIETLFDLMENDEDWMTQLDAAEGLVRLGERGGLDFLYSAEQSDSREVREYAKEILDDSEVRRMVEDLQAEEKRKRAEKIKGARGRIQKGRKVYVYSSLFLPLSEMLGDSPDGEPVDISALDDVGLEGWEVINFIPKRGGLLVANADAHFTGAYFILRKELTTEDVEELDRL